MVGTPRCGVRQQNRKSKCEWVSTKHLVRTAQRAVPTSSTRARPPRQTQAKAGGPSSIFGHPDPPEADEGPRGAAVRVDPRGWKAGPARSAGCVMAATPPQVDRNDCETVENWYHAPSENSPAFQRWASFRKFTKVPSGTEEPLLFVGASFVPVRQSDGLVPWRERTPAS